jgi:hypothetical protein
VWIMLTHTHTHTHTHTRKAEQNHTGVAGVQLLSVHRPLGRQQWILDASSALVQGGCGAVGFDFPGKM